MALIKFVDLDRLARFKENLDTIFAGKKDKQAVVRDPVASGTSITFIDSISQNDQGVISPTKKTVRLASTFEDGLMSATDKIKLNNIGVTTLDSKINIVNDDTGFIIEMNVPQITYGAINVLEGDDGIGFTFIS